MWLFEYFFNDIQKKRFHNFLKCDILIKTIMRLWNSAFFIPPLFIIFNSTWTQKLLRKVFYNFYYWLEFLFY